MRIVVLDGTLHHQALHRLGPREARERLMQIAVDNLAGFIAGRPANVV